MNFPPHWTASASDDGSFCLPELVLLSFTQFYQQCFENCVFPIFNVMYLMLRGKAILFPSRQEGCFLLSSVNFSFQPAIYQEEICKAVVYLSRRLVLAGLLETIIVTKQRILWTAAGGFLFQLLKVAWYILWTLTLILPLFSSPELEMWFSTDSETSQVSLNPQHLFEQALVVSGWPQDSRLFLLLGPLEMLVCTAWLM